LFFAKRHDEDKFRERLDDLMRLTFVLEGLQHLGGLMPPGDAELMRKLCYAESPQQTMQETELCDHSFLRSWSQPS
jgi:hypothetical protein